MVRLRYHFSKTSFRGVGIDDEAESISKKQFFTRNFISKSTVGNDLVKEHFREALHRKALRNILKSYRILSMNNQQLPARIIEIYQIASELCGAGLAAFNGIKPAIGINNLISPMSKQGVKPYTNNPVNTTDWNPCAQKLAELIYELRQRGLIK